MSVLSNPFYRTTFIKNIFRTFKYAYIMCAKKEVDINECTDLLLDKCTEESLINICKHFCLIKVPISLLYEYEYREKSIIVDGTILKKLFEENEYDINEIIIQFYELNKEQINVLINLLVHKIDLQKVMEILTLSSYYTSTKIFDPNILPINMFWKNVNNCKITLNNIFEDRIMVYEGQRMDKISYKKSVSLEEIIEKKPYYLDNVNVKTQHINIGSYLRICPNRTFYMSRNIDDTMNHENVNDFFENIVNEKHKIYCLIIFITSKEYCHLVINNKKLLKNNMKLFLKYSIVLSYYLGYAWNTLYIEETLMETKCKKTDRFVFDIDTANRLISFPFTMENIHTNPYATVLLDRKTINSSTNYMGENSLKEHYKYYGVCNKSEAFKRLNIFATGDQQKNIFNGMDKMFSITGSVMPAILLKMSPFLEGNSYDEFFNKYYENSDIDIMCSVNKTDKYIQYVSEFIKMLCKNLEIERKDINVEVVKKPAIIISKYFFKECLLDLNDLLGINLTEHDLKEKYEKNEYDEIISYAYNDYLEGYQKIEEIDDNELYKMSNNIVDKKDFILKMTDYCYIKETIYNKEEQCFFINDFRRKQDYVSEEHNYMVFKVCVSIKYKIVTKQLKRAIEIFRIPEGDPFNTVAKFHMPCVRAYIQDDNIYMLPSFISSMMTLINVDYKYFAGSRDPIKIVNKYRDRGFSFIANINEKKAIVLYNTFIGDLKCSKIFGFKSVLSNHIKNSKELKEHYINYYKFKQNIDLTDFISSVNFLNYNCISEKGYITPLKMWLLEAFCDFIYN